MSDKKKPADEVSIHVSQPSDDWVNFAESRRPTPRSLSAAPKPGADKNNSSPAGTTNKPTNSAQE